MNSRTSPFSGVSNYFLGSNSDKDSKSNDRKSVTTEKSSTNLDSSIEQKMQAKMNEELCKLGHFAEWFIVSLWRVHLTNWMNERFGGSIEVLDSQQNNDLNFRLTFSANIGELFGIIETIKKQYKIKEYAVSPTSLEQIFNSFTRKMDEDFAIIPTASDT